MSIFDYYKVLGVTENTTAAELKSAYRKMAKVLHPDRNKSPNAHQKFIFLTEAYEYLTGLNNGNPKQVDYAYNYEYWQQQEREQAREQAATYAQMEYEQFTQSDFYKSMISLEIVIERFFMFSSILLIAVLLGTATHFWGVAGFAIGALICSSAVALNYKKIKKAVQLNSGSFMDSFIYLLQTNALFISIFTLVNLYIVLNVGLQTLLPFHFIIAAIALVVILSLIILKVVFKSISKFQYYFYSFCLAPLLITVLLQVNYTFSRNPIQETYIVTNGKEETLRGQQESTLITLPGNVYQPYWGIRVFLDYEQMRDNKKITYTFKQGLFGVRIMSDYKFEKLEPTI